MKPIETIYKGYRFRSRLEARWAVFFDACDIQYEYEPEGFDLGDGIFYLPDFYIPDWNCFIEIKPITEHFFNIKAQRLAMQSQKMVFLCTGEPYCDGDKIYGYKTTVYSSDNVWFTPPDIPPLVFMNCRRCDGYVLESPDYGCIDLGNCHTDRCMDRGGYFGSILDAYRKARQARFEHGETPR